MIAPSELRIGNYVLIGSLVWTPIDGILSSQVFACNGVGINYIDIDPIPITPEWLERLGFEWDIYYQGYCDGNYLVNIRENGTISFAYGKRRHDEMQFLPYIKYVHQLQNLYHAITGNELKIK